MKRVKLLTVFLDYPKWATPELPDGQAEFLVGSGRAEWFPADMSSVEKLEAVPAAEYTEPVAAPQSATEEAVAPANAIDACPETSPPQRSRHRPARS